MTVPEAQPLERSFYRRHPAEVAPALLGMLLIRQFRERTLCGRIVETEAYTSDDPASHTFRGMTNRNRIMFGEVGHAYVYFIHGLHHCLNVTARLDTAAGGVLIRALEPLEGLPLMQELRNREKLKELTSGPAKLTQALSINKTLYGIDMTQPGALYIAGAAPISRREIRATPRVGISRAVDVPWRFLLAGSPWVSR